MYGNKNAQQEKYAGGAPPFVLQKYPQVLVNIL